VANKKRGEKTFTKQVVQAVFFILFGRGCVWSLFRLEIFVVLLSARRWILLQYLTDSHDSSFYANRLSLSSRLPAR